MSTGMEFSGRVADRQGVAQLHPHATWRQAADQVTVMAANAVLAQPPKLGYFIEGKHPFEFKSARRSARPEWGGRVFRGGWAIARAGNELPTGAGGDGFIDGT
jgi:hypothetical protein